jgi:toxin ParE1/3/4
MTKFHVQWTASARQDLEEIIHYIAEDSTTNAFRLLKKIEYRANSLNQYPNRGRFVPELLTIGISTYRELVIRPWRLLYRIDGKHVYVIALLDSRRNLADILLERLIRDG